MPSIIHSIVQLMRDFFLAFWNIALIFMGIGDRSSRGYFVLNEDDSEKKAKNIEQCLHAEFVNLWELRELALSRGGLLQTKYRQQAWPILAGLTSDDIPDLKLTCSSIEDDAEVSSFVQSPKVDESNINAGFNQLVQDVEHELLGEEKKSELEASLDLIRRDAGRSVIFRYSTGDKSSAAPEMATKRLVQVLEGTLQQPETPSTFYYYQGLHDVAGIILHNMDYQVERTTHIMSQMRQSHLRDAMRENFGNITWLLDVILLPLIKENDPHVHYALQMSQVDLANLCLPWVITWFTHDLHNPETASRLLDAFLSGHPLMPVYFAVALITHPTMKRELVQVDLDDPSSAFLLIKKMPSALSLGIEKNIRAVEGWTVPIQEVLDDSISIMNEFPPRSLLDLVDPATYARHDLRRRVSSIALFKTPASWSLSSGGFNTPRNIWSVSSSDPFSKDSFYVRAKLASGVPLLMATSCRSALLENRKWGSRRLRRATKTRRNLKNFFRSLVGKQMAKSS